ncbi:hypothetical protein EVAR_77981_1 [Eumeta japonica]|uniref:Uncharacterized protein n=1 Tax=Eumeta variegata TaxID=151549 RepID=A0A4C1T3E4_EUMVA|nr:hypothetical protein EVAR_77981_1 [Eumeta japonica]
MKEDVVTGVEKEGRVKLSVPVVVIALVTTDVSSPQPALPRRESLKLQAQREMADCGQKPQQPSIRAQKSPARHRRSICEGAPGGRRRTGPRPSDFCRDGDCHNTKLPNPSLSCPFHATATLSCLTCQRQNVVHCNIVRELDKLCNFVLSQQNSVASCLREHVCVRSI